MGTETPQVGATIADLQTVFRLGKSTIWFRQAIEICYLRAADMIDACYDRHGEIPNYAYDRLGALHKWHVMLSDDFSSIQQFPAHLGGLVSEADRIIRLLEDTWLNKAHLAILEQGDTHWEVSRLKNSPFAHSAWEHFEKTVGQINDSLPSPHREIFQLGRIITRIRCPLPSDSDEHDGNALYLDSVFLCGKVSPTVTRLMRGVANASTVFSGTPEQFGDGDAYEEALRFANTITARLGIRDQDIVDTQSIPSNAENNPLPAAHRDEKKNLAPEAVSITPRAGKPKTVKKQLSKEEKLDRATAIVIRYVKENKRVPSHSEVFKAMDIARATFYRTLARNPEYKKLIQISHNAVNQEPLTGSKYGGHVEPEPESDQE